MERTDEQLLPAVYFFVGPAFNATPSQLGYLTMSRALVQALASPIGGLLGAVLVPLLSSIDTIGSVPYYLKALRLQERSVDSEHWIADAKLFFEYESACEYFNP